MTGTRREAFSTFTFLVEIDGDQENAAYFRSVSGLKSEAEAVAVQEGGVNEFEHKLIGRTKFPNLVFKRGLATANGWKQRLRFMGSGGGGIQRFNGTITQLGPGGQPVKKWQFIKGWVAKWEGPDYDSSKNEISIETIEIAHEGLQTG
ncbi:MAG TPA: phage tail protein [Pseudomonadota bacterium]|nr:phage tail protein [Pseudomonadota bacterium]